VSLGKRKVADGSSRRTGHGAVAAFPLAADNGVGMAAEDVGRQAGDGAIARYRSRL